MIIKVKNLKNYLFVDIETATLFANYEEMDDRMKDLWNKKARKFLFDKTLEMTEDIAAQLYEEKAAIFAEFAKVICISAGYLSLSRDEPPSLRIKSFSGDEKEIFEDFNDMLNKHYNDPERYYICGHNIKEFDIPFLCRRCIINGVELPKIMNISGKKPWQVGHLVDTMELWKFGDYKNYTSLNLLAASMGIPSPKDDIDGSQVGHVYWQEKDLQRIVSYCERDVVAVAQVVMKFAGKEMIEESLIEIV